MKKKKKIVHKCIRKEGDNYYLCNQTCTANPYKIDVDGRKINCKNCLTILRYKHIRRHEELHNAFDELMADYIKHTGNLPSSSSLMDLAKWNNEQTIKPDE